MGEESLDWRQYYVTNLIILARGYYSNMNFSSHLIVFPPWIINSKCFYISKLNQIRFEKEIRQNCFDRIATTMKEKILLLGGTGKISSRIAPLLSLNSYSVVLASRSGSAPSSLRNCHGVKFDWLDLTSYLNPFNNNNISANSETFSAIFLVAPPVLNGFLLMKEFIDLAIAKGVKRFVLLSGSLLDVGDGPMLRRVSEYIISCDVEYTFLRPSWFMGNISAPFSTSG